MATMTLERFHEKLNTLIRTGGLSKALAAGGAELGVEMANISQTEFLTGPRPARLGVVSGALRRSVKWNTKATGSSLLVSLQAGGGPEAVDYAAKHELGIGVRQRPFLRPARAQGLGMAPRIFTKHIAGALRSGLGGE